MIRIRKKTAAWMGFAAGWMRKQGSTASFGYDPEEVRASLEESSEFFPAGKGCETGAGSLIAQLDSAKSEIRRETAP
jgi:tRNA A37 threonylcarbamoyladenosine synthetase subunit TsaC/SUA5/YrdC